MWRIEAQAKTNKQQTKSEPTHFGLTKAKP
jgi:hypothetical protein